MSKPVKSMIERDLSSKLKDIDSVAVISPRGIDAIKTNNFRRKLRERGMRMTVVKNTLAKRAAGSGKLSGFDKLLDGPSAVIYGKGSMSGLARLLLDEKKENEKFELRGIFFDGEVYVGDKGIEQVSKLPTREEAIGLVISAILSPGKKLAGAIKAPGSKIASILKTIEEKAAAAGPAAEPAAEAAAPAAS